MLSYMYSEIFFYQPAGGICYNEIWREPVVYTKSNSESWLYLEGKEEFPSWSP